MKLKKILKLSSAVLVGISTIPINALINPTIVCAAGEEGEATQQVKLRITLTGKDQQDFGSQTIQFTTDTAFSVIKNKFKQLFGVKQLTILFDGSEIDDEMTLDDLDVADNLDPSGTFNLQATTTSEPQPAPSDQERPTATVATQPTTEQTSVAGIDIGDSVESIFGITSSIVRSHANQKISDYFRIYDYVNGGHSYSDTSASHITGLESNWYEGINGNEDVTTEMNINSRISLDLTKFSPEQRDVIAKLCQGEDVDYNQLPFKVSRWEELQKMYQLTDGHGKHFSPQPKKMMLLFFKSKGTDYCVPVISMEKLPEDELNNFTDGNICASNQKANPEQVLKIRPVIKSLFDALLAFHQHQAAYGDDNGHSIAVDPVTKKISLTNLQFSFRESPEPTAISADNRSIINCLKYLQQNAQSKLGCLLAIYDQLPDTARNLLLKSDKLLAVINEKLGDLEQADQGTADQAFQDGVVAAFTTIVKELGGSSFKLQSKPMIVAPTKSFTSPKFSLKSQSEPKREVPKPAPVALPQKAVTKLAGNCNSVNIGDFSGSNLGDFRLKTALNSDTTEVGQQVAQFFQIHNFVEAENQDPALSYVSPRAEYTRDDGQTRIILEKGAVHRLDSTKFNSQQLEALRTIREGKPVDFANCPLQCPEYANLLASWTLTDQAGRHLTIKPGKIMFVFYKLDDVEYYLPIFSMD